MTFLRNTWYIAAWGRELQPGTLLRRQLLGEFYVLFRDANGVAHALVDRCPHRFAPLSMGKIVGDGSIIQCPYHGLQFNSSGTCVFNPHGHGQIPKAAAVPARPVAERFSAIWIWMGDQEKALPALIPDFGFLDPETHAVACDMISIASHYELETDNILDLSHIEYLHPLFSSSTVSKGKYQCTQEGDTVWSRRFITDDELPPFLHEAFGLGPGKKADRWLNARWDAPACMALWTGGVESGMPQEAGREVPGAHLFTPESENLTHYFFATSFPRTMGSMAQQLADQSLSLALGPKGVFTAEDKPMLEAQARNMQGRDFWSMRPLLLGIDAAGVRARRVLAKKIEQERALMNTDQHGSTPQH